MVLNQRQTNTEYRAQKRSWNVVWASNGVVEKWGMDSLSPNGQLWYHTQKSIQSRIGLRYEWQNLKTVRALYWKYIGKWEIEIGFKNKTWTKTKV